MEKKVPKSHCSQASASTQRSRHESLKAQVEPDRQVFSKCNKNQEPRHRHKQSPDITELFRNQQTSAPGWQGKTHNLGIFLEIRRVLCVKMRFHFELCAGYITLTAHILWASAGPHDLSVPLWPLFGLNQGTWETWFTLCAAQAMGNQQPQKRSIGLDSTDAFSPKMQGMRH